MGWSVVGIDLTTMRKKPATIAFLNHRGELFIYDIKSFNDLVKLLHKIDPNFISIDSPFSYPEFGGFRNCDKRMKELGMKPLPPGWRGMRKLVEIATMLIKEFPSNTIECFPTGSLNIKYKRLTAEIYIKTFLKILIEENLSIHTKFVFKKDALDALICALASKHLLLGELDKLLIIKGEECEIYVPKL